MASTPTSPATTKTSAMPRSAPVPNQSPIARAPAPSVIDGMTHSWVAGATRNAVSGDAACSTLCAKPKTRPCRSNGTTRCSTVCSAASAKGISSMKTIIATASSRIDERSGNSAVAVQVTTLTSRIVRTGLLPRPTRATSRPPTMTPVLSTPHSRPHACTDTSDSP